MKAKFWPICWLTLFVLIAVGIVVFLAVLIRRKPEYFSSFYLLLIIIVAALGALVFLSFFIKQKRDYFYSHDQARIFYVPEIYATDIKQQFHLSDEPDTSFYGYNPSIMYFNGKIIAVSRISDHDRPQENRICKSYDLNKSIEIPSDVSTYFNIFTNNKGRRSGIITWDLGNPAKIGLISPDISEEQLCDIQFPGFEDPRLFLYRGEPWIISCFRGKNLDDDLECGHKLIIFPMKSPSSVVVLKYSEGGIWEKNWLPFENNKKLYVVYSFSPHVILEMDVSTGNCRKAFSTPVTNKPNFKFYGIGGGSPPVLISNKFYISAAHTRAANPLVRKNFFYLFDSSPPFAVHAVSPEINLDSNYKNIEFISGLIVVKDTVIISAGIDDCYSRIMSYKKQVILDFIFRKKPVKPPKKTKLLLDQTDRDLLYHMMYVLHRLLEDNHVTYWIMGGAAIAVVREKTLIAWDDDIDICIPRDEIPKLYALDNSLQNYGYHLDKRDDIIRCNRMSDEAPYIDIFDVCLKGDTYFICPPLYDRWPKQSWKLGELFPLKYYSIGPLQLHGPKDIKPYLKRAYKDYKIPTYWKPHNLGKPLHSRTGTVYIQGKGYISLNNLVCLAGFSLVFEPSLASILISCNSKFLEKYEKNRICLEIKDKKSGGWKLSSKSGRSFSDRETIAGFRKFIDEFGS